MFTRVRFWQLCLVASLLSVLSTGTVFADDPTLVSFNVNLAHPAVPPSTATIKAKVYSNPANRGVTTILAVHGLTETASTFGPLASKIFADNVLGYAVKRVIAIDLVGHGDSSNPVPTSGLRFGDMTINDNVSVVIQSIDALRAQQLGPQVILGHSMGGLAIQGVQEALLAQGSSLAKHGVLGAILMAAVPNFNSAWTQQSPPADATPFLVTDDPANGVYLSLPAWAYVQTGGFRLLSNLVVANAPTAAQVTANGWNAKEPGATLFQLTATSGAFVRPGCRQGAFALQNGTLLSVISFSQDVLTPAVDQNALYVYLNGGSGPLYRPVVAADAVHSMFLSNPAGLITALRNGVM
jgi:pimeloyl-ACP methyl ester carboxylesterase